MEPVWSIGQATNWIDGTLELGIGHLTPGQKIMLEAFAQDDLGQVWRSFGLYRADDQGMVDTAETAPEEGTYDGIDANGLLWSMRPDGSVSGYFMKSSSAPHAVTFRLTSDGVLLGERTVDFHFVSAHVRITEITEPFAGKYFCPEASERGPLPTVLVLGGSAGGLLWSEQMAALLSAHGFAALALAYFDWQGRSGLPNQLAEVPLEAVDRALRWLQAQPGIDAARAGIMGLSKGSELALLYASMHPQAVRAVVGYSPASHVFEGISIAPAGRRSSWTHEGRPLPYLPYPGGPKSWTPAELTQLRKLHEQALETSTDAELEAARIPVEAMRAPALLITGAHDATWPAAEMAEGVLQTLEKCGYRWEARHEHFPEAGHLIDIPNLPVTAEHEVRAEAAVAAAREAWQTALNFLQRHLV
ncbi:acyl-CoA thioesterase/BAAT N-terminal domain-containing protein [Paenibacillus tyrfis]|uniref:acyl-CoA thioesterase/BAAT N-terminal domain-containing protein n=1 Tax=Paenibacillus tyrfis TaxID=1501230 RepID=UPI00209CBF67|nr:acyl-CoA thioesterase/bile acid-CoA:amino acid N-acyltransferase family protein [Paenibacillus tyrfis]MCP1307308.1 acyl-CoA thioesterase/BAAT N-terminal domain-containing protein [Paenibacillus tyrfis]